MAFEAVYHGKTWFTFDEIKRGTGLAVRTLRAALVALRRRGYIESYLVPGAGRRLLHRLRLDKFLPEPELEGVYLVDMGGSNQSLFLLAALFAGQGSIHGQGSAAVPLLVAGLLLSWLALPGWTELVLMCGKSTMRMFTPFLG